MKTLFALFALCAVSASAFKLMTYQIHFGLDTNNVANLSWTAAVINEQQATMCAIQAVDVRTTKQAESSHNYLAEHTNLKYNAFHTTVPKQGGKYGIGMLSALTPNATLEFPYHAPDGNPGTCITEDAYCRGATATRVELEAGKFIWFVSTHFGLDETERMNEAHQLVTEIIPALATPYEAVFVGGNFNVQPSSEVYAYLTGEAGLTDMWTICGSGDGFTYPSTGPDARIDYIFQKGSAFKCTAAQVINSHASDHMAVVYTF